MRQKQWPRPRPGPCSIFIQTSLEALPVYAEDPPAARRNHALADHAAVAGVIVRARIAMPPMIPESRTDARAHGPDLNPDAAGTRPDEELRTGWRGHAQGP